MFSKAFAALVAALLVSFQQKGMVAAQLEDVEQGMGLDKEFKSLTDLAKEDMSMSPTVVPASTPSAPPAEPEYTLDCASLNQMFETDPESIKGSELMIVKEECDQGIISSADEVAATIGAIEEPNGSMEDQFAQFAENICINALNTTDPKVDEIKEACEAVTRNDEVVVDAFYRLSVAEDPQDDDPLLVEETCISLEKNRKEIEAGLLILASRSDEQRRRLDDSNSTEHPVTTYQLGSDMLNILDCFCDKTNPGNDGCSKKALSFGEAVAKSLTEKTTEIGENPAEFLLKAESVLKKHTHHLRKSGTGSPESVISSVERAMSELHACDPPGVVQNPYTGDFDVCLYAGPYFECALSWGANSFNCVSGSCGGGKVAKLKAEVKFCKKIEDSFDQSVGETSFEQTVDETSLALEPAVDTSLETATLEMELKICVDVISDLLDVLGRYIPALESFMNEQFNIYGGCYRLAWAMYDIGHNRMEVTVGPIIKKFYHIFSLRIGGAAWMRIKPDGCAYSDNLTWFSKEHIAYNRGTGVHLGVNQFGTSTEYSKEFNDHKNKAGCLYKAGPWSWIELYMAFGIARVEVKFDWFETKVRFYTEYPFSLTARMTSTSKNLNWKEVKPGYCYWDGTWFSGPMSNGLYTNYPTADSCAHYCKAKDSGANRFVWVPGGDHNCKCGYKGWTEHKYSTCSIYEYI